VHAWEAAAALHAQAGRSESHRRCAANAVLLASHHGLAPWPDRATPRLTGRELEIARLAAERIRSREIAEQLGLSVRTVDNHLAKVFRKLGVSRREELVSVL
ncbi:MAG: helix-turn-helix transcriptional regulator, partial [Nocardioides sp.]